MTTRQIRLGKHAALCSDKNSKGHDTVKTCTWSHHLILPTYLLPFIVLTPFQSAFQILPLQLSVSIAQCAVIHASCIMGVSMQPQRTAWCAQAALPSAHSTQIQASCWCQHMKNLSHLYLSITLEELNEKVTLITSAYPNISARHHF